MSRLQDQIHAVRTRQQQEWLWNCLSNGMLAGGGLACMVGLIRYFSGGAFSWTWIVALAVCGPLLGLLWSHVRARTLRSAASAMDSACQLKDRSQTALQFLKIQNAPGNSDQLSVLHRLQLADAERHAETIQPEAVIPIQGPRSWPLALSLTAAAILLALFSGPPADLSAAEVPNAVVLDQAARAAAGLEELRELQASQPDPELQELVKDLQEMIEQMQQPGVDPKEALAKLSEMEASLQTLQQKLDDPQLAADLQQIGEALSLSDAMAQAGAALSKGEMEKAAAELEKMEMPKLDRQTEKSVTEKLDQLHQNPADGSQRKSVQEAASQISQGLSQGNRGKFQDGMHSLASEARKQGSRKKLSDLLRKQCQCLSECKSECESECRNQSTSSKPGGKKAGTAASGNQPGDKTPQLKTQPSMNLKGQESSQGDVDVETESSTEQQQTAVRAYREKADQYEALSESVLESESIPLGHRQTIRKYFEMIRPGTAETDAVNQQIGDQP